MGNQQGPEAQDKSFTAEPPIRRRNRFTAKRVLFLIGCIAALVGSGFLFMKPGLTPKALALLISYFATGPFVRLKTGHGPNFSERTPAGSQVTSHLHVGHSSKFHK